ncbi:MAG TPA: hypothetical protein VFV50_00800 [Bdellovibrionales bacterium]|nr:hypothetical protein [Bdellovibrionales bacterium]
MPRGLDSIRRPRRKERTHTKLEYLDLAPGLSVAIETKVSAAAGATGLTCWAHKRVIAVRIEGRDVLLPG